MKNYFTVILISSLFCCSETIVAQVSTSTSTSTVNGKTTTSTSTSVGGHTYSASSSNGYATGVGFGSGELNDTTGWKYREISKEFSIQKNVPIFIESSYRNINIETWDQPIVRIVAKARYKDDKDANKTFDEVFEQSNIQIKNDNNSFEILGLNNAGKYAVSAQYFDDNSQTKTNTIVVDPNENSVFLPSDSTTITASKFRWQDGKDNKIEFHFTPKDSTISNINNEKIQAARNKIIVLNQKKVAEKEKLKQEKIANLSKQLATLSKKLATLTLQDEERNNKEIEKINQEIGKISNQIAFQSLGSSFKILSDSINWNIPKQPITISWSRSPAQSFLRNPSPSGIYFSKNGLEWTIYLPKDHKVSIDSKYGNLDLKKDINNAKIVSKYGNIDIKNADNLIVRNEYGNIYTGNVQNADISIRTGKLKMQNVKNITLDSKNANIDLDQVDNIKAESSNDNYDISSAINVDANKNYGSFRLGALNGNLNFNGANADINIRNISPNVKNISVNNKFAKIELPFNDIKNYTISVKGKNNSSYDSFDRKNNTDNGFTASSGSGSEVTTTINCNNCQLDFK